MQGGDIVGLGQPFRPTQPAWTVSLSFLLWQSCRHYLWQDGPGCAGLSLQC